MNDIDEKIDIAVLKRDFDYLKSGIDDIKEILEKRDASTQACKAGFDGRIKKLEDAEKKVKIYIAVAIAVGGALMWLVDRAIDFYMKFKS